jgi:bacterioferritin (cytochrome b1)
MGTFIGTEPNFITTLKKLIELDSAVSEAYGAVIEHLKNDSYRNKLTEFKSDHEQHMKELSELLIQQGQTLPKGHFAQKWLTKSKVLLATFMGDKMMLTAMRSNELETHKAYEKAMHHPRKLPSSDMILKRGLEDEKHHQEWIEQTLTQDFFAESVD